MMMSKFRNTVIVLSDENKSNEKRIKEGIDLHNEGLELYQQGLCLRAIVAFEQAISIFVSSCGQESLCVVTSLHCLAGTYLRTKQYDGAFDTASRMLYISVKTNDDKHTILALKIIERVESESGVKFSFRSCF
jgi:hypothetical protein